jgi:hypothetical protein
VFNSLREKFFRCQENTVFNPFKDEDQPEFDLKFHSCRAVNNLHIGYKKSVDAIMGDCPEICKNT